MVRNSSHNYQFDETRKKYKISKKCYTTLVVLFLESESNQLIIYEIGLFKAFIVCTTDVVNIGFMMVIYGVVGSVFSFIFGVLVKWIGRQPIFLFGCALSLALLIALLMWTPVASQLEIFYLVSSLWALTFSVWQTQLNCNNKTIIYFIKKFINFNHKSLE